MNRRGTRELPFWAIKFKRFRLSKGLSQQETGDLLNLSISTIRSYEQGLKRPKEKTMRVMEEKMGLDIYETFFNEELEDLVCRK